MTFAQDSILTPELVQQLQCQSSIPKDTWYVVSAAVLCALNRPDEVADLFPYAIAGTSSVPQRQQIAARYREALIKVIPISGMPKVSTLM
jgi:hypothetical protein